MWLLVNQTGELQNRLLSYCNTFHGDRNQKKRWRERDGGRGGGEIRGGNESGRLILIRS